jgi:chorismate dehydratase
MISAMKRWRLGVVSYLNSRPLVAGLEADDRVELFFGVPSRLPALLDDGQVDAALVPVIDLAQPHRDWQIVSDACIGCDGETLTVRVFSRVPAESIQRLCVDGDSHTSVVLADILWRETYGRTLEIVPFAGPQAAECEAVLLIGDKVVHNTLIDHEIETDLGSAWKSLTSLPFVFAAWAAPRGLDVRDLAVKLSRARDTGVESAEMIAEDFGPALNWPVTLAKRYLTKRLKFVLGPRQRLGMERFFELAKKHGLISPRRDVVASVTS